MLQITGGASDLQLRGTPAANDEGWARTVFERSVGLGFRKPASTQAAWPGQMWPACKLLTMGLCVCQEVAGGRGGAGNARGGCGL